MDGIDFDQHNTAQSPIYLLKIKVGSREKLQKEAKESDHRLKSSMLIGGKKLPTVSLIFYWHCFARSGCPRSPTNCTNWSNLKCLHFVKFVKTVTHW